MKAWLGQEGGTQRIIFLTGQDLRFYLTIKAFGLRLRVFGRKPFVWLGRAKRGVIFAHAQ